MIRSFALALALTACGTTDTDDTDDTDVVDTDTDVVDEATYADVQSITATSCAGCHGTSGGMSLSGDWYDGVVDVASTQLASMNRVEPGDPETSYLVLKLRDTHAAAGGSGGKMPASGSITTDQLATIEEWITAGAAK